MTTTTTTFRHRVLMVPVVAAALLITSCSSAAGTGTGTTASTTSLASSAGSEVTVADQWVRATVGTADPSMTTVFGEFTNHTGKNLTIVSAVNDLTDRTELHRMTMTGDVMVMGPAVGGIPIPANSTTSLDPNSLHIMVMGLKQTIRPGDDVRVTATLSDGSKVSFDAIGKQYAGGDESYPTSPGMAMPSGMAGMSGMSTTHG